MYYLLPRIKRSPLNAEVKALGVLDPEAVEEKIRFKENENNKIKKQHPELDVSYLSWWLIIDCPLRPPINSDPLERWNSGL